MLTIPRTLHIEMVGHCLSGLPDEACGLLAGPLEPGGVARRLEVFYPSPNLAGSATIYTIDPKVHLVADRDATERGLEIVGVVHSHTHTDAYPSSTDVAQAPDPTWHYLLVSLREATPSLRSYRIVDGTITETPIAIEPG